MPNNRKWLGLVVAATSLLSVGGTAKYRTLAAASPSDAVTAGEFIIDPPTLINLGFEWFVDGDDNRNGSVAVSYRRVGEPAWQAALPLMLSLIHI